MAELDRYRVRTARQTFTDKGPDLLRTKVNARATLRALMERPSPFAWFVRKQKPGTKGDWHGPMSKLAVLKEFDDWKGALSEFVVGRKDGEKTEPLYVVRFDDVTFKNLANCSKATSELHSLIHHQFPKVAHSGDYLYKKILGTDWYSDHAWGTALDESPRDGMPNDDLFTWLVRMFSSLNADADYILGSIKGRVMEASAPDWTISFSSAAESHLWHNHISVVDHDGEKPPRQGGA